MASEPAEGDAASEATFSGAGKLGGLSPKQRDEIESQSRPNAALIHETIRAEGMSELERSTTALLLSGLAAGLSMGFSLLVQGLLHARLPEGLWRDVIASFGYSAGFLIVILGRQQLFTENTLTAVLPLLHRRDATTLWRLLRLWLLVLVANEAGAYAFAVTIAHTGLLDAGTRAAVAAISRQTVESPLGLMVLKAVFAGWLIALLVWLLPAAETARPVVIILMTYVIALGGFAHVIAGSVDCFFLVETGGASWADFGGRFFGPSLLGNVLGGVALVAVLNYGQAAPDMAKG